MKVKKINHLRLFVQTMIVCLPAVFGRAQTTNPVPFQLQREGSNEWLDIRQLGVEGRGWNDTKDFYDRLPAKAEGVVAQAALLVGT